MPSIGTLIVAHGPEELCPGQGDLGLAAHNVEELREQGEVFAFFDDVMQVCLEHNMQINIDLKGTEQNLKW